MLCFAIIVSGLLSPVPGENLLANPSFEEVTADGRPRGWSSFVMPQAGALAEADPESFGGETAVMLHNPEPYDTEPANNWSQVIVGDFRDKVIEFSGFVRTEAAGQAALWIQCFQQRPTRVVAGQTSETTMPMSGTTAWSRLNVEVTAPGTTDFVVVRCVLKGRGTAWFDELRLDAIAEAPADIEEVEPPTDVAPAVASAPDAPLDTEELLQLSQALQRAVSDLEATNAKILQRVNDLQADLEESRAEYEKLEQLPVYGPHPLVPRGFKTEDIVQ